ncbi:DUF4823 domain-containing protein [Dickeya solani]|uniref:Integron protein cassette protein n=1 Tax=Dickeya solani D s0432-1 TaxID=1231725 RepID=A0AAV3KCX9_9GAMM|nr:DUF4823 domain-containing protein [Dickeya solani]AUC44822.1 hypothetical protein D083_4474 [Dickeya solani RNS 08.23.3.1.A]AYQ47629.1 hypothetical protein CTB91_01817 [Dickeya solani]AYQ51800.1 hypothetical protein DSOL99_01822 [Dickeya solani]ERO58613.1 Putative integron protein cassette protein [Dickeya solani D s0432-1]MBD3605167.1 hypothetical protein [Dickeya solani]
MKNYFLVSCVIFLSGCSAKYNAAMIQKNYELLTKDKEIIIAVSDNGVYLQKEYAGSGSITANVIKSAFSRYSDNIKIIGECKDINCLVSSFPVASGYYVVPQILHWEDRATEWSGIPDKVEVKITVYNAENKKRLSSVILSGKSKFVTFGGDHPQDLLPDPINNYISSLY